MFSCSKTNDRDTPVGSPLWVSPWFQLYTPLSFCPSFGLMNSMWWSGWRGSMPKRLVDVVGIRMIDDDNHQSSWFQETLASSDWIRIPDCRCSTSELVVLDVPESWTPHSRADGIHLNILRNIILSCSPVAGWDIFNQHIIIHFSAP